LLTACGKPRNWATWWIVDGGDDADTLRCVDNRAKLNSQVVTVEQQLRVPFAGGVVHTMAYGKQWCGYDRGVEVFLTGDGKAMVSMNFMEGKQLGSFFVRKKALLLVLGL
jgi:hypothetical protein